MVSFLSWSFRWIEIQNEKPKAPQQGLKTNQSINWMGKICQDKKKSFGVSFLVPKNPKGFLLLNP